MKIISWNINGIKRRNEDGNLDKLIKKENPDILCIQEIRTKNENVLKILGEYDYIIYPNAANDSGYYGTAICTKFEPISVKWGIGDGEFDDQGRVIRMEFENFYLFNVYAPTGTPIKDRTQEESFIRKCEFFDELKEYVYKSNKPSIICGDFNRVSKEIDAIDITKLKKTGFAPEEQEWFKEILTKYIDAFREFNEEGGNFTWYSSDDFRKENRGFRFDYFLVSNTFKNMFTDSYIIHEDLGSDHAPIVLKLNSCPSCGFVNHLSNENCSYCGNKLIDDEEEEFDYEEKLEIPNDKIILLDLNFTLIANSEDIKGLSLDEKIKAQEYELELIDLIKDNYVILITASPYNLSHKILRDIKEKTGFEPNESYWNFRRQPPALKEYWMENEVLPMHGDNPEQYLAIESNSKTRKMYEKLGIEAKPKQCFINIKK